MDMDFHQTAFIKAQVISDGLGGTACLTRAMKTSQIRSTQPFTRFLLLVSAFDKISQKQCKMFMLCSFF